MQKKHCNYIVTINNPTTDHHGLMEIIKAAGFKHYRGQLERGESGVTHIQATFGGKSTRFGVVKKLLPTAFIDAAKSPFEAWEYCGKEDTRVEGPVEFGVPPARLNKKGDKASKNMLLLEKGAEQAVRDGDIPLRDYAKIKHNIELFKSITVKHAILDQLTNQWIYGPPGVGKSRGVREEHPDLYDKPLNKWWDDYKG